ncbi:hypothetical protein [Hymenobacter coccineus]|uniref:Uncharacterized protein n=1 Tax=Hymenobacter coccineus TaxID=1908235 RepID=A0A1G1TIZ5_9BACT|nr:hypothetical protein [Hymenobacter coccineus]OGX90827.1 hypothetical protein BEN49_00615 [Hymenobacter coccineus]
MTKRPPQPYLLLLPLLVVLLFGNCGRNVYDAVGPGATPAQITQLKKLSQETNAAYNAALKRPVGQPGPTPAQVIDSAKAARRRLLTPAQNQHYDRSQSPLPFRYPRRPPKGYVIDTLKSF